MSNRLAAFALAAGVFAAPAFAQDFPVTIEHEMGTITMEEAPQRVVSLGYHEQDFLYALGVAPVGVREWFSGYEYATLPWAEDERAALGATPEVTPVDEVNLEWVLSLDPDLIVAIYMPLDAETYAELSRIAPVVTTPLGYPQWGAPWQAELRIIDTAVHGNTDAAEEIIADIEAKFVQARADYPQIEGKTGTNYYLSSDGGGFVAWGSDDLASKFLIDLGLVFPPELDAIAQPDNRIDISFENMDMLDTDVTIWPLYDPEAGDRATIEAMPRYQSLAIATEGRSAWLDDPEGLVATALSFQSPLALDYLLETVPPVIAAAVDGDPDTIASLSGE